MIERCDNCRFFYALTLRCRKKPPVPVPAMQGNDMKVLGVFPETTPTNWCGEYELDKTKES